MVAHMGILVALVRRQNCQGSSKSEIFFERHSLSPFPTIRFILVIDTITNHLWIRWWRVCLIGYMQLGKRYLCYFEGWLWQFQFEESLFFCMVGWSPRTTSKVNKITVFKRFRCKLLKTYIMFECTQWDGIVRVIWTVINWPYKIYNGTVSKST